MLLVSKICQTNKRDPSPVVREVAIHVLKVPREIIGFENGQDVDGLSCAFVSLKMLRHIGALNRSWVTLHHGKQRMLMRLIQIDEDELPSMGSEEFGAIYLNPMAAFNLKVHDGSLVDVSRMFFSTSSNKKPPVAGRVTIARVRSPESSGHGEYGPALREFFKVPRLLRKLDIIAIPMKVEMKFEGCGDDVDSDLDDEEFDMMDENMMDHLGSDGAAEQEADPTTTPPPPGSDDFMEEETKVLIDHALDPTGKELPTPYSVVFFQVTELTSGNGESDGSPETGMIIDGVGGETMLAQAGAVNTKVPDRHVVLRYFLKEREYEEERLKPLLENLHHETSRLDETSVDDVDEDEDVEVVGLSKMEAQIELERVLKISTHPKVLNKLGKFSVLVFGGKGTGKRFMIESTARQFGFHVNEVSLTPIRGLPEERAVKKLKHILTEGAQVAPCVIHLRHLHALAPIAHGSEKPDDPEQLVDCLKNFSHPNVIVIASTQSIDDVPAVLRGCFTHEIGLKAPDKEGRLAILSFLTKNKIKLAEDVDLDDLATRTAGRTAVELKALFANATCLLIKSRQKHVKKMSKETFQNMEQAWNDIGGNLETKTGGDDEDNLILSKEFIDQALEDLPSAASMDIGAPKIPQVYWKDVGGLAHAKDEILDMVQLPLQHPELFASGVRQRSGILLYGPPGTGKTLLAKAVATECNLNFISVKGPELLDMYIGESERKVRQVFETARAAKPCVLFFDELDSLAPQRGRGADSGGVMDRVVSQLLTEIDGMQGNADVFVIGATNRPDLLDQSLLRPGRFDRLIYLGICRDRDAQLKIVKALSRKYVLDPDVDFDNLLERCPFNFTGADFYALCSGAMAQALQRRVSEIQEYIANHPDKTLTARRYLSTLAEEQLHVTVKMVDYLVSLENTIPSVSEDEIRHYESLRDKFSSQHQNNNSNNNDDEHEHNSDQQHPPLENGTMMNGHHNHAHLNGDVNHETDDMTLRACPNCQVPTMKQGGCDKMTCGQCQHEYNFSEAQPLN